MFSQPVKLYPVPLLEKFQILSVVTVSSGQDQQDTTVNFVSKKIIPALFSETIFISIILTLSEIKSE
jgi:hypothetical protein